MVVQPKMDGKRILMLPLVFTMAAILNFLKRNWRIKNGILGSFSGDSYRQIGLAYSESAL
jgi:hypothetical protein